MEKTTNKYDPITGKVRSVFWHYSIPEIVGLLAMSSAGLVDSIFLGNYVGAEALATISLSIPALTLFWAFAMLIAVGGSVVCGKYLGQKNQQQANEVFTSTMLVGLASAFLLLFIGIVFLDQIVGGLGATDQVLAELLEIYLGILMWFTPFFVLEIVVFYFVRLDGQPKLASGAFVVADNRNRGQHRAPAPTIGREWRHHEEQRVNENVQREDYVEEQQCAKMETDQHYAPSTMQHRPEKHGDRNDLDKIEPQIDRPAEQRWRAIATRSRR